MAIKTAQSKDELMEILRGFCTEEPSRYDLSNPFWQKGHWYATNGHWCARLKDAEGETSTAKVPDATALPWKLKFGKPFEIPDYEHPEKIDCEVCAEGGADKECCWCDGEGFYIDAIGVEVSEGRYLNFYYLEKLRALGALIAMPEVKSAPWRFEIGNEIEGLLCDVTKNNAN